MAAVTEPRIQCLRDGCSRKGLSRYRGYCYIDYTSGLEEGWLPRRQAARGNFKHGSTSGKARQCSCVPCHQARADSLKRSLRKKRQEVADGTYTGPHTGPCYRYGCRCEQALLWQKQRTYRFRERQSATKISRQSGLSSQDVHTEEGMVTVSHYPPVGVGVWICGECGVQMPYRSSGGVDIASLVS